MTTLEDAVDHLFDLVYVQDKVTSQSRMDELAQYCIRELETRGIKGWKQERTLNAYARQKQWDIVHPAVGKPKIAISLKSILRNHSGTVPNRTDDLIGEVADLQMRYPEIVIGYLAICETVNTDSEPTRNQWVDKLDKRLNTISGRKPPFWGRGTLEASRVVRVEFEGRSAAKSLTDSEELDSFFNTIVQQYEDRYQQSGQQTL